MKQLNALMITSGLLLNVFSWAQTTASLSGTFLRMTDGTVYTVSSNLLPHINPDKTTTQEILLTEKPAPALPTTVMGGNYGLIGNVFVMATSEGYFYKYPGLFDPAIIGGNFFINNTTNELVTVSQSGLYFQTGTYIAPATVLEVGGNYYTDTNGGITMIRNDGTYFRYTGMKYGKLSGIGGSFFELKDKTLITIDQTSLIQKSYAPTSSPKIYGGNYFIGNDGRLYTVDSLGGLSDGEELGGVPALYGYSFIVFKDGSFRAVAGDGSVHKRMIKLNTVGARTEVTKLDLSKIDLNTVYQVGGSRE